MPSRVSYDVRWAGGGAGRAIRDTTFGFVGDYVSGPATITFEAKDDHGDVIYRSDPAGQSNVGQPGVGTEGTASSSTNRPPDTLDGWPGSPPSIPS